MIKKIAIFLPLLLAALAGELAAQPGIHNVQGIPTPQLWQGQRSSFDKFDKYVPGQFLNGLSATDPVIPSLGAKFSGPYFSRQAYLGVFAFDIMTNYPLTKLDGLNGGLNWNGPYVVHGTLPFLAWDTMTNASYTAGTVLNGLNGGDNNGGSCVWGGPYVEHYPAPVISLVHCGGCGASGCNILFTGYTGANHIYFTTDGTTPAVAGACGGVPGDCLICPSVYDAGTSGTWTFADTSCNQPNGVQEEMTINTGTVIKAIGSTDGVHFSSVASFTYVSCP